MPADSCLTFQPVAEPMGNYDILPLDPKTQSSSLLQYEVYEVRLEKMGTLGRLMARHQMQIRKPGIVVPIVYFGITIGLITPVQAIPTASQGFFDTQNAAEEFFDIGRERLQREIKLLEQKRSQRSEKILKIDEKTKLNEKELENWDDLHPQHQLRQQ